ncbi:GtrA family protein [Candidatus Peribacteria bacterium]|nr:GtrA family protein [Candidatus Peribacteria bacterium]
MFSFRSFLHRHYQQGMRFILCGGTGATIDLSTLTFFVRSGVNEHAASAASSLLSVLFIFLANKYFTFRNKDRNHGVQILKFSLVYGLAYIFNISVTSFLLVHGMHYFMAKVFAIGTVVLWNYSLSHTFIFRKNISCDPPLTTYQGVPETSWKS